MIQMLKKIENNKYSLPIFFGGVLFLLFLSGMVIPTSNVLLIIISILFLVGCCLFKFEKLLCLLVGLISFRGLTGVLLGVNIYNILHFEIILVCGIKYLFEVIKHKNKIVLLPLILSVVLCFYGLINLNFQNISYLIADIAVFATAYLCYVYYNQVDLKKVSFWYFAGLIGSILGGFVFAIFPATKSFAFTNADGRFNALAMNANFLSILIVIALSFLFYLLFKKKINNLTFCVLALFLSCSGLFTKSKAFLVCLAIYLIVLIIYMIVTYKKKGLYVSLGIVGAGLILALIFIKLIMIIVNRFTMYTYKNILDRILTGRWTIWKNYLTKWAGSALSIIFGLGVTASNLSIAPHSAYVEIIYSYGLVGMLLIIGLIIAYVMGVKNKKIRFSLINVLPIFMYMLLAAEENILTFTKPLLIICCMFVFNSKLEPLTIKNLKTLNGDTSVNLTDLVTIIVPVFKVENYLKNCVDSILNQTYKNLEIILVDDGSPDSCPTICDEYAKLDGRVKVIHKQNGGLSDARNAGMEIATGKYLMFVDSDDIIHPQMVEILYNNLIISSADVSLGNYKKIKDLEVPKNEMYNLNKIDGNIFKEDDVFDLLYNKKVPLIMTAWSKLYKREIFNNIKYPVGQVHEDEAVIHLVLNECKTLVYCNCELYYYTQRGSSIVSSAFSTKRLNALRVLKNRIEFVKQNKPQFEQKAVHYYLKILILYYYYSKWANLSEEILQLIKNEISFYETQGYSNKFTKLFKLCPKLLGVAVKTLKR